MQTLSDGSWVLQVSINNSPSRANTVEQLDNLSLHITFYTKQLETVSFCDGPEIESLPDLILAILAFSV